ncbi:MAG: serine/threonine-protein kinase [Gemmataceae bacterium]
MSSPHSSGLVSRLRADLSSRWQRGERISVEHYLVHYPDLSSDAGALLEMILAEASAREQRGDTPLLREYQLRFPSQAEALARRWAFLELMSQDDQLVGTTLPGSTAPPEARRRLPMRLPGFILEEEIGRGGMGVVFRGRQEILGRPIAVKLIRSGPLAGSEEVTRFRTEAQALSRLNHPRILTVHSLGEWQGCHYLVMDYIPGGSLADRLKGGPLPIREAVELVRDLARAMQCVHDVKVVHRDLKPANILAGPLIADFGLARLLDEDGSLTASGLVLGTPQYMAPEQASAQGDIGPAADVYSLGVILYECLTGRPPLNGSNRLATLDLVKRRHPTRPSRWRPEVSPDLDAVCLRCLSKQPRDRYPSASELADDLDRWLKGEPTRARPANFWSWCPRWMRDRSEPAAMLAGVPLLFLAMSVFSAPESQQDQAEREVVQALRKPGPVLLTRDGQKPRWSRMVKGDGTVSLNKDGSLEVESWSLCLIELAPNPQRDRFRFKARLRHDDTRLGWIGLYVGRKYYQTWKLPGQFWEMVWLNDRDDLAQMVNQQLKIIQGRMPNVQVGPLMPAGNPVMTHAVYDNSQGQRRGGISKYGLFADVRLKAGPDPRPWRQLQIEVRPESLSAHLDGQRVGSMSALEINTKAQELWSSMQVNVDELSRLPCGGEHNPRGGIGLVIYSSRAAFRDVVVESLD